MTLRRTLGGYTPTFRVRPQCPPANQPCLISSRRGRTRTVGRSGLRRARPWLSQPAQREIDGRRLGGPCLRPEGLVVNGPISLGHCNLLRLPKHQESLVSYARVLDLAEHYPSAHI